MNVRDLVPACVIVGAGVWVRAPRAATVAKRTTRERRGVAPDRLRSDARQRRAARRAAPPG